MALQHTIYFGTYTGPKSQGIYRSTLNDETGELSPPELVVEAKNPSFLALSPNRQFLYAVFTLEKESSVGAWRIESNGTLTPLNHQSTAGGEACHVWIDPTGTTVLVANYGGGNIAAFPVQADGSLGKRSAFEQHKGKGPNKSRQERPHAHSIYTDPTNKWVYACDLGTDEVRIYRFDAEKSKLKPNRPNAAKVPAGGGPRHLACHKNGYVYVNNELTMSVTVFKSDSAAGTLTPIQTLPTLAAGDIPAGASTAEIFIHPNGKWLYVSNRGPETITLYAIGEDGRLTWLSETTTPKEPRGFGISPDGKWLVVGGQREDKVGVFRIDSATGELQPTPHSIEFGAPICVEFAD